MPRQIPLNRPNHQHVVADCHGEARGLMNTGIEIRQDLIGDQAGETEWSERLATVFG